MRNEKAIIAARRLVSIARELLARFINAFDMTEDEWERYHKEHPGAKKYNHHIIPSPREVPKGHPDYRKTMREIKKAKADYFKKQKQLHPNYIPIVTKKSLKHLLYHGEYSVISGGVNTADPREENLEQNSPMIQKRIEALRMDLDALGVKYTEVTGLYGKEEPSFLISHTLEAKAAERLPSNAFMVSGSGSLKSRDELIRALNALGTKYNQDSVSHVKDGIMEWHYTTDYTKNQTHRGKRVVGVSTSSVRIEDRPEYYSEARFGDESYTMWMCNMGDIFTKTGIKKEAFKPNPYA